MIYILITLALIFTAVMVAIIWGFVRTLRREQAESEKRGYRPGFYGSPRDAG